MAPPFNDRHFEPPLPFVGPDFRLEPLGPEHNERDHGAWMSSIEHIHNTPGFGRSTNPWPHEMTLEENLGDMRMHAAEFVDRSAFTYSVLDDDDVIGCVYIYPPKTVDFDADVRSWVIEAKAELDSVLWQSITSWLKETWTLGRLNYATRE